MTEPPHSTRAAPLPFLGVLRIAGPDAASFLQGQVTHDTRLLEDGRTLLCACNTPQGRVVALLRLRQAESGIHALLPADMLERVAAHLRRFVLRARVDLQVATDLQVAWLRTSPPSGAAGSVGFAWAADRWVIAAPAATLSALGVPSVAASGPGIEDAWWSADIAAGLPQVFHASTEAFVPQMLNLDLLDGISFSKGCYTGQEIVARTQHLGRIKRRTLRYRLAAGPAPAPTAALLLEGTKVGEVVVAAAAHDAVDLLAVTNLEARGRTLCTEDGREAVPQDLPYEIAPAR